MTQVIIGNGPVGQHLAQALLQRGNDVRIVTRYTPAQSPQAVRNGTLAYVTADMTDPAAARNAVQGASVVYNASQAPYEKWAEQLPTLFRSILTAAEHANAKLVVADNLYQYGPNASQPLRESLPYQATGKKGAVRAQLTRETLLAHAEGKLPVAIAQASDFFGPGVTASALGRSVFPALLQNKPADLLGNPDLPHSYTYIKDFAETLALLGTTTLGDGRTWHVPNAPAQTNREIIALAAEAAGTRPQFRASGRAILTLLGIFSPLMREFQETLYQFDQPFIVDSTDFETRFGFQPTPLADALTETVRWYQSTTPSPSQKPASTANHSKPSHR